ncbi:hypothetical protein N7481_003186 [Penicillium waksmanii]|uniref:uncharacterized protein n=1 Tax=Penicillium waksmanii TaxID=69791 RepID=UPI002546888F|nr:uncharacterized protein N7481_003186 [Penicillium waksmanii]KAJ5987976.1 hypothetical protein N7481_003186 [Penicillium waksmanii]
MGQAVGLKGGEVSKGHSKHVDDPRIISIVNELLSAVRDIAGYSDEISPKDLTVSDKKVNYDRSRRKVSSIHIHLVLKDKARRIAQVECFSTLVEDLYKLVPIDQNQQQLAMSGLSIYNKEISNSPKGMGSRIEKELQGLFGILNFEFWLSIAAEAIRDLRVWLLGNQVASTLYEDNIRIKLKGTCEWILNKPFFRDWSSTNFLKNRSKALWIHGPAGFGKSILCTKAIEHLLDHSETPTVHFFRSSDFESKKVHL